MKLLIENFKKYLNEEKGNTLKVTALSMFGKFRGDAHLINNETGEIIAAHKAKDVKELATMASGLLQQNVTVALIGGESVEPDPAVVSDYILKNCEKGCQ
tara:strand:+ start:1094 stop:1393 length:300 start_codon:yes stop_codon:yes gene_type:complete